MVFFPKKQNFFKLEIVFFQSFPQSIGLSFKNYFLSEEMKVFQV